MPTQMKYYPVNLDVRGHECLVVGGGAVGTRKVRTLLDCGARVTVVSKAFAGELIALADMGRIRLIHGEYSEEYLDGRFLVIGATGDPAVNHLISRDAHERNMLCNIADDPEICNFILPSIITQGDLIIAISTSGTSPAFAKKLRKDLQKQFGPEYGDFLKLMGAVRKRLLKEEHAPEAHKPLFERLIDSDLPLLIREGREGEINRILRNILGEAFEYGSLMTEEG
jgi:precorrin-2 dehydrogenase / sirohydrochlorin ferrochelatase